MKHKTAFIKFWKNSKELTKLYNCVPYEEWRKSNKEQAETIARGEICWYNHPTRAAVTMEGTTYYFRITYYKVFANKKAELENRYTSLAPVFHFTCQRRNKV